MSVSEMEVEQVIESQPDGTFVDVTHAYKKAEQLDRIEAYLVELLRPSPPTVTEQGGDRGAEWKDRDIHDLLNRFRASCEKHLAEFMEANRKGSTSYNVNWADLSVVDVDFRISQDRGELRYTLGCLIEEGQDNAMECLLYERIAPEWDGYGVEITTEW